MQNDTPTKHVASTLLMALKAERVKRYMDALNRLDEERMKIRKEVERDGDGSTERKCHCESVAVS